MKLTRSQIHRAMLALKDALTIIDSQNDEDYRVSYSAIRLDWAVGHISLAQKELAKKGVS